MWKFILHSQSKERILLRPFVDFPTDELKEYSSEFLAEEKGKMHQEAFIIQVLSTSGILQAEDHGPKHLLQEQN